MRFILILFVIFCNSIVVGQSRLVGDAFWTENQKAWLKNNRVNLTSGEYVATTSLNFGDWNEIKANAETFRTEVSAGSDSQRWDNFYTGSSEVPNGSASLAYTPVPTNGVGENITHAAIISDLNGDADLAIKVFTEILWHANNDDLDAGNGGLNRRSGGPARSNASHGQAVRFNHSGIRGGDDPYHIAASKLCKYMEAYALVAHLLVNDATYLANYEKVEWWFDDWATFSKGNTNNQISNNMGSSWRTGYYSGNQTLSYPITNTSTQSHTHYDVSGNATGYEAVWMQASGLNNRVFDMVHITYTYGLLFNDSDYMDYGFDFFQAWITSIYPDSTLPEWFRSNTQTGKESQGLHYTYTALMMAVKMAQMHAVAVANGLVSVSDDDIGMFYDHTTDKGLEDNEPLYEGTPTGGTVRGLYSAIINQSKYHKLGANGGYLDVRYSNQVGVPYGAYRMQSSVIPAMAWTYYQTQELIDYYRLDMSTGYQHTTGHAGTGLDSQSSWGQRSVGPWGIGVAIGLYADVPNVFSDTETNTTDPFFDFFTH